jgi:uncharacterized membrane protein YgcG
MKLGPASARSTVDEHMSYEQLKQSSLNHSLSDLFGDIADLVQKEFRLAKAEIAHKLTVKIQGIAWLVAAGFMGLIAALLVVQAIVFGIASLGIAMHWSCLIVAAAFAAIGAAAFFKGRTDASEDLTPTRTLQNITRDMTTASTTRGSI